MNNLNLVAKKIFDNAVNTIDIYAMKDEDGYPEVLMDENNIINNIEDVLREEAAFGNFSPEEG